MGIHSLDVTRSTVEAHDHAVVVYRSRDDLLASLHHFLEDGLGANDLMVLVHAFESDKVAWDLLCEAYPAAARLNEDRIVVVNYYEAAFEKDGRIDYPHVGEVVTALQADAEAAGRDGLRVFVDASRQYLLNGRVDEWFAFEAWLGARLQTQMGLVCAYPRDAIMEPQLLAEVLRTHTYRFAPPHS